MENCREVCKVIEQVLFSSVALGHFHRSSQAKITRFSKGAGPPASGLVPSLLSMLLASLVYVVCLVISLSLELDVIGKHTIISNMCSHPENEPSLR